MKKVYLVNHNNGEQWEDNFEYTVSVHPTEEAANACIQQYLKWEEELSRVDFFGMRCKLEERFDENESDEYNEQVLNQIHISMCEFLNEVLNDIGIPEEERERYEHFEDSSDQRCYYRVVEAISYL